MKVTHFVFTLSLLVGGITSELSYSGGNGLVELVVLTEKQHGIIDLGIKQARLTGLDVSDHKISLYREGELFIVLFSDPDRPKNQFGSGKRMPSFEVVIDHDLKVIKSYFSR